MNQLSLRNIRLKFKTFGKLLKILEASVEYILKINKENRKDQNMEPVGLGKH
jgi:hypothetical protein